MVIFGGQLFLFRQTAVASGWRQTYVPSRCVEEDGKPGSPVVIWSRLVQQSFLGPGFCCLTAVVILSTVMWSLTHSGTSVV